MSTSVPPQRAEENKGPTAIGIVISVSVLSTLFTAARLFVRGKILGKFHLDDYLIVASVLCGWINVRTAIAAVSYGNGRHFDVLTLEQKSGAILWTIAGFAPGVMSFGLPKIAVVALLTRIMNPSRWHALFQWCLSIFCLVNFLGCVIILFAQCQPSHSQWDFSVEKTCWDKWILVYFAIYSGDIYLAVYPAVVLARLQMRTRKKVALSIVLGIGSVSAIVAIYKCTRLPSLASPGLSYLVIWTVVEGSTMIIAACIPVLQPLGELTFGKRMSAPAADDTHTRITVRGPAAECDPASGFQQGQDAALSTSYSFPRGLAGTTKLCQEIDTPKLAPRHHSASSFTRVDQQGSGIPGAVNKSELTVGDL
ncbi:integral membrane protein [Colletotrichum tabaci]|uniref:Integral membrane protein n=1 Tax=Colletotrichum tabaci TaxID=1209068 RepID=A0AAV9T1Y8_9PEZI